MPLDHVRLFIENPALIDKTCLFVSSFNTNRASVRPAKQLGERLAVADRPLVDVPPGLVIGWPVPSRRAGGLEELPTAYHFRRQISREVQCSWDVMELFSANCTTH